MIIARKKGFNSYRIEGNYVYILLNSRNNPPMEAKIDLEDLEVFLYKPIK